jgi:hypothetical protein
MVWETRSSRCCTEKQLPFDRLRAALGLTTNSSPHFLARLDVDAPSNL